MAAHTAHTFVCRSCEQTRPWYQEMRVTPCFMIDCPLVSFCMECATLADATYKAQHPEEDFVTQRKRHVVTVCSLCESEGTPSRPDRLRLLDSNEIGFGRDDVANVIDLLLAKWETQRGSHSRAVTRCLRIMRNQVMGGGVGVPR